MGDEGVYWRKVVRGAIQRPLRPKLPEIHYEAGQELEHPLELLEPLLFLLSSFLHDLCRRLESQSLAAGELHLCLTLEDRTEQHRSLRLPFPTRDVKFLLKLLQLDLEAHPPGGPVTVLAFSIQPVSPRILQNGLFVPAAPEPEKLELTLNKIRSMVGMDNVSTPELKNTRQPGGWALRTATPGLHLAFRFFRPPLRAKVETDSGVPRKIFAPGVHGKVTQIAGPWRTSGDWWKPDFWDRDEWDLALSDGALYRIYLDRPSDQWFLEGSYD